MTSALYGTDIATASKFLADATETTLRQRLLARFLDEEGRINRNATGKDLNWLIEYKLPVAQDYTPGQPLTFANDNFNLSASVTPVFFVETSGMNYVDKVMNSGPTQIIDNYVRRGVLMLRGMQVYFSKGLYNDSATNPKSFIGLNSLVRRNITDKICTNADRIAVPLGGATYAGLSLAPGSYGGSWSNNIPTAQQMSTVLGSDWPDGQGSPDQLYDATTPRLYNENTNQWLSMGSAAANSNWDTNCLAMISRANTDLNMNSVDSMMPNIYLQGAGRTQSVKNALRVSFRDTMYNNAPAEMLGYRKAYNYEGAAIDMDHECPADRTFGLCAASMDIHFYGSPSDGGKQAVVNQGASAAGQEITGGVYTTYGPERIPGTLEWGWIMVAGGFIRHSPKWVVCFKDFTTGV